MSKVNDVLQKYVANSGIILEQDPPLPPPPPIDPMAAPAAAVPPPAGEAVPPADEGGETEKLTDLGYVEVVRHMLELLSINPKDMDDNDLKIFSQEVNPKNAMDIHKDLKDLIASYGSPMA